MKCAVLVDWLTFSVKTDDPYVVIKKYLGMDPDLFQDPGYGLLGYQRVLRFNDIAVCYDARENEHFQNLGVCVSMSGNGCRTFEQMSKLAPAAGDSSAAFLTLFRLIAGDELVNVSRLDVACDDKEGYLDMDTIVGKIQQNEVNTRSTKRSVIVSYDGTQRNGSTVYIGAPSSDFRIRIYDKALEMGQEGHWVRFEMVIRAENANAFVAEAAESETVGELAAKVINDKFAFIERDDTNISRCTVCVWWQQFVDELEKVHLFMRGEVKHSVERIDAWLQNQIAPSLSVIIKTLGWSHLFGMAMDAASRLSDKQISLISDWNSYAVAGAL